MSLNSQRSSPLSHPFEVNGYLTSLELRPQYKQLIDISEIPVRERKSTVHLSVTFLERKTFAEVKCCHMDVDKMPMESLNALGVLISHLFIDFQAST